MLHHLFSSKARVKLLTLFLTNPEEEFFVRQLTRTTDEQINSIRRELENLKEIGLVRSRVKNRKKYFKVNQKHILFEDLKNLIYKTQTNYGQIAIEINTFGKLDLLAVSGKFISATHTPVDLFIIGELDRIKLENYIKTLEKQLNSEIKYAVMTKEDFTLRRQLQDKFIKLVLQSTYRIIHNQLPFKFA
jgi:hypothetical protein